MYQLNFRPNFPNFYNDSNNSDTIFHVEGQFYAVELHWLAQFFSPGPETINVLMRQMLRKKMVLCSILNFGGDKQQPELRVVSNFGDSDRGAGENKHARARNSEAMRREGSAKNEGSTGKIWRAPGVALPLPGISRACVYFRPPHDRYRQN